MERICGCSFQIYGPAQHTTERIGLVKIWNKEDKEIYKDIYSKYTNTRCLLRQLHFTLALGFVVCLSVLRKETLGYLIICEPHVSKSSYVTKVTELGNCICIQWVHSSEAATRGVLYKKRCF